MSELHAADHIMIFELKSQWNHSEGEPLQERFEQLIAEARRHYMVFYRDKQMHNVIYALGSIYKEESKEKFEALSFYIKARVKTQEFVDELVRMTEEEAEEYVENFGKLIMKFHDPKDPEKLLLPLNWNELWTD